MSYCLNPACQHPQNLKDAEVCQTCGAQLLLNGIYRALKPLGAGGMGRTFLALDTSQAQQPHCVIKQFFPQNFGTGNHQKAAELFQQEATRLKELGNHPQIPQLLGAIEQENQQYLVQQYIKGRNLAQELSEEGAFSEAKIRQLLDSLLPVLQFVHQHRVIHRDIKPENIIRAEKTQQFFLVDFGAAKFTTQTSLGKTGTMIGSAAYTAPEQVRGKAIFASDFYSLGVTCIHLLTQVPPFDLFDSSEDAWVWRHYLPTPLGDRLSQILDKMLQSATKLRYQSAAEIRRDLSQPSTQLAPRKKPKTKWLVGGTIGSLLAAYLGLGYLNSLSRQSVPLQQPVALQPSSISPYNPQSQPRVGTPNFGGLSSKSKDGKEQVFPLKHTEVTAKITGNVSRVEVVQSFENPYETPLEAVYKFPLPDESAVDDMEIRIGDRTIKGFIKKREEAKKIFEQAKQEGKTAGLLEQQRDNVFTQSVTNIKPGEKIEVVIRYTDSLKFQGGDYEFVFPMVVGPRYDSGTSTESTGGAATINSPMTPPKVRAGHDIGVTVEIDAGVPVATVSSPSHKIQTQKIQSDGPIPLTQVQLSNEDTIPNKDLILRYRVAGQETQSTVLTHGDNRGGHFAAYLIPAIEYQSNQIVPKDVVFLMDTSGSQDGAPLEQSKALMQRFIKGLNPGDTFTIIDFANRTQALSPEPLANTEANRKKALDYINRLQANGGTELLNGINTVLNFPSPTNGRLRSIVLLTDGYIDNDNQVIAAVQKQLKPGNRLYSFGVGSSVNRFLLNRMAEVGRGTVHIVRYDEPIAQVTEDFFRQINNPVLTNIEVKWEGLGKPPEMYPLNPPDLFAEQPLVVFGRKQDRLSGNLRIAGTAAGGKRYEKVFHLKFDENGGNVAIAQLWGRAKIKELTNQMAGGETASNVAAVTDIALAYRLMSSYTSFVAVSEEVRVGPNGDRKKVQVPVETPDGMSGTEVSETVPEPSVFWSILLFGVIFGWKRWIGLRKGLYRPSAPKQH